VTCHHPFGYWPSTSLLNAVFSVWYCRLPFGLDFELSVWNKLWTKSDALFVGLNAAEDMKLKYNVWSHYLSCYCANHLNLNFDFCTCSFYKVSFGKVKYETFAYVIFFSLRSTLAGVTATTPWCSFLPRSITWRTFEPFTGWTASLLVCYSLGVLPKRLDLWNTRSVTAKCRRSMCVEWKENSPGVTFTSEFCTWSFGCNGH
jgi:hypothetical protein